MTSLRFYPAVLVTVWQNSNWFALAPSEMFLLVEKSVSVIFFLFGTQAFSCTFEPALLWLLVADQR